MSKNINKRNRRRNNGKASSTRSSSLSFFAPLYPFVNALSAAGRTATRGVAQSTRYGGTMHLLTLFGLFLAFAVNFMTYAAPSPTKYPEAWSSCLTDQRASELVQEYLSLTSGESAFDPAVARALLTSDFTDLSGSIASLINGGAAGPLPLDGEIFNKTSFITSNAEQGDTTNIVKQTYHTCDTVIFRFEVDLQPQPVTGITIMETVVAPKRNRFPFQIKTVYAELNSAAFLIDIGAKITPPPPPPSS